MNKPFKRLLLVYYHPIVFDLAQSFRRLFETVDICVTPGLRDNYGDHNKVISEAKSRGFDAFLSPLAVSGIRLKKYDLIGLDGVFQGDKVLMDVADACNVPFFCINGYPHNIDEPSKNILSFSWYLPQMQYRSLYPTEAHVKQYDWAKIAKNGQSDGKNICVFYPEMIELKQKYTKYRDHPCYTNNSGFVSLIHRFEECNKESYEVFSQVKQRVQLENYSGLTQEQVWKKLGSSFGLIHLKHADCPGISVLEAMLLRCTPIVMRSFVMSSQNQDLLIDEHSAIVCDTVPELIQRAKEYADDVDENGSWENPRNHALMMTDWGRQSRKVETFFERCMK